MTVMIRTTLCSGTVAFFLNLTCCSGSFCSICGSSQRAGGKPGWFQGFICVYDLCCWSCALISGATRKQILSVLLKKGKWRQELEHRWFSRPNLVQQICYRLWIWTWHSFCTHNNLTVCGRFTPISRFFFPSLVWVNSRVCSKDVGKVTVILQRSHQGVNCLYNVQQVHCTASLWGF